MGNLLMGGKGGGSESESGKSSAEVECLVGEQIFNFGFLLHAIFITLDKLAPKSIDECKK